MTMSFNFLARMSTLALACAALAACSGGGGDADQSGNASKMEPICQVIGGGASRVAATADPGSTFDNEAAAFDGDLNSFATFTTPGAGNDMIRGTLQTGMVAEHS